MHADITSIFVYGTLKRGQVRAPLWPHQPVHVSLAKIKGELHDLGPYPALAVGKDWIAGEAWSFDADQMARTLEVLDEIEELHDQPDDLYRRIVVDCWLDDTDDENRVQAFTYLYAMPLTKSRRVMPGEDGLCTWP